MPNLCGVGPGRVNLIGEHTDYNNGFVFPMALPMVTVVVGKKRDGGSNACSIVSLAEGCDAPDKTSFSCVDAVPDKERRPKWAEYVRGVLANFHESLEGMGFDAVIATSVPLGNNYRSKKPCVSSINCNDLP